MSKTRAKQLAAFLVVSGLCVLYFSVTASAENKPNIHIGALEVHPMAVIKETWDSNIYLQNTNRHSDWITDYGVGCGVQMPLVAERGDDFMAKASYMADWIRFSKNDDRSRVDHHADGLLKAKFANDWGVNVNDVFVRTADPPNDETTVLEKRNYNLFDTTLSYEREKIRLDNSYTLITNYYDRIANLDRNDHRYTVTYFYQMFPKTQTLGEFNIGRILYKRSDTNSNSTYYQVNLGLVGAYWPKVTGTVKGGFKHAGYDNDTKKNFNGFTAFGNLKYDMTLRTNLNLYGERGSDESSYDVNSYYEFNRIGLKVNHLLMPRLTWDIGPYFSYDRYPSLTTEDGKEAKRQDTIWAVGTGLTYELKEYILLTFNYDYRQRDSKFNTYDYVDHKVSLGAKLLF